MSDAQTDRRPDLLFRAIGLLIVGVVFWIALIPISSLVSDATMRRFHLQTERFPLWCAQQFVPSMYNFGNKFETFDERPDVGSDQLVKSEIEASFVNHFPVRSITFGHARFKLLMGKKNKWVRLTSTYGSRKYQSWYLVRHLNQGDYELERLDREILAGAH